MQNRQSRRLQAFRRVGDWLQAHPNLLQPGSPLATLLATLLGIIGQLEANEVVQDTQHKLGTTDVTNTTKLRTTLRTRNMQPIAQVARGLKPTVPGIGILKMPDSHMTSEALVAAATSMAENAAMYKDVLIQHGLPQTFLDSLASATAALKANTDARGAAGVKRAGATQAIHAELKAGITTVSFIDAVVRGTFADDPATLAEWQKAKRMTLKGVPAAVVPAPVPVPTPVPVHAAAS